MPDLARRSGAWMVAILAVAVAVVVPMDRIGAVVASTPKAVPSTPGDFYDAFVRSPSKPGLWDCATKQTSTAHGDRAVMSTRLAGWTFRLDYVSWAAAQVLPDGHPTTESVEMSHAEHSYVSPIRRYQPPDLNLIINGVCLVAFTPKGPPTGIILYDIPGSSGCCSILRAVIPTSKSLRIITKSDLPPTSLQETDGAPILVTGNFFLEGRFTDDADSSWPVTVLTVRNGAFVDVTRLYPSQVGTDSANQWAGFKLLQGEGRGTAGALAQWVADECNLNNGPAAWTILEAIAGQGAVTTLGTASGSDAPPLSASYYLVTLARALHANGYCTTVSLPTSAPVLRKSPALA
jgi:hypothetical protein